jgi:hypothetical protein
MKSKLKELENIVLDLENEAEGENYHDLSTIYRTLAEILVEELPDEDALRVMVAIKAAGGFLP